MTLFEDLSRIIELANREVLDVYAGNFNVEAKSDDSPVTEADHRANHVIFEELQKLDASIPVVSEESRIPDFATRSKWQRYWLVDPLDGTKDFVSRRGYFTINIALVEGNEAQVGIVSWPTKKLHYYGEIRDHVALRIHDGTRERIRSRNISNEQLNVIMSFRHGQEKRDEFLESLKHRYHTINSERISSSLKFCRIAEGNADLYPQFGGTSEWDTAAAQAVLEAAGGKVLRLNGERLLYNTKAELLNPSFLAVGDCRDDFLQHFLEVATAS